MRDVRRTVPERHAHLVDIEQRSIACACTACGLLFTRPGGRYRTVPDRVRHDPDAPLTGAEWAELQIPVGIAFFFVNSALGHVVASYPSPAGVTECELDLAAWDRLAAAHPLLRAPSPDVEAILVVAGSPRLAGGAPVGASADDGTEGRRGVPHPDRRLLLAGGRPAGALARLRRRRGSTAPPDGLPRRYPGARPPAGPPGSAGVPGSAGRGVDGEADLRLHGRERGAVHGDAHAARSG